MTMMMVISKSVFYVLIGSSTRRFLRTSRLRNDSTSPILSGNCVISLQLTSYNEHNAPFTLYRSSVPVKTKSKAIR